MKSGIWIDRARGLGIAYFVTGVPEKAALAPGTAFTAAETHAFRRTYALAASIGEGRCASPTRSNMSPTWTRAIAFYRDKLGLELKFESPFWTEFATGETIARASSRVRRKSPPARSSSGFAVDDLGEFYARREELGIEFTREPKEMHGIHIAGIRDADGAHVSVSGPV